MTDDMIRVDMRAGEEITSDILKDAYEQFKGRVGRYNRYRNYYVGDQDILGDGNDGAKIVVNMVRYGIDNLVSYMAGNAPKYTFMPEDDAQMKEIVDLFLKQNLPDKEAEIVRGVKIFGRTHELVYHADGEGKPPRSVIIDPDVSFVAYDMSIDPDSVFGAIIRHKKDEKNDDTTIMDVYSNTEYSQWTSKDGSKWARGESAKTRFTRVPLIEYLNNDDALSDVSNVEGLQDALNSVVSDRQDDKDAFASAVLALYGMPMGFSADEIKKNRDTLMKRLRVIQFENKNEGAEYLIKQMDEAGAQTYTDYLTGTIHKLMRVPDFSDEAFAGNASGVALQYKLYGTQNMAKITERTIRRGFRRRCKLYASALYNTLADPGAEDQVDVSQMDIVFNYSTVVDPLAEAQAAQAYLAAGVSEETVLNNLSVVEDVKLEMERLANQREAQASRENRAYNEFTPEEEEEEE